MIKEKKVKEIQVEIPQPVDVLTIKVEHVSFHKAINFRTTSPSYLKSENEVNLYLGKNALNDTVLFCVNSKNQETVIIPLSNVAWYK